MSTTPAPAWLKSATRYGNQVVTDHTSVFNPSTPNTCRDCGMPTWAHREAPAEG